MRRVWLVLIGLALVPSIPQAEVCPGSKVVKANLTIYDHDLTGGLTAAETTAALNRHLPFGKPACDRLLPLKEYLVCYDVASRIPAWVAYELTAAEVITTDRKDAFRTDPRLTLAESSSCADYRGSGFDRGQALPRDDMNRTFELQADTFLLSNMSPQTKALNEGIWAYLENRVRSWAKANDKVYVISGPIFSGTVQKLNDRVAIPTTFFKIVLREVDGTLQAQTFRLFNDEHLPIARWASPSDTHEARSGSLSARARREHEEGTERLDGPMARRLISDASQILFWRCPKRAPRHIARLYEIFASAEHHASVESRLLQ